MQYLEADSWVWIPDEDDAWLPAKVQIPGTPDSEVTVLLENGKTRSLKGKVCKQMDPASLFMVDDNIGLELSEAAILHNCRQRYFKDIIYTYTSAILISINPYKKIPIYGSDIMKDYITKSVSTLPPHIFAVSQRAYSSMLKDQANQSVICSGESGAGKTEAAKMIILYLTVLSGKSDGKSNPVEEKLLEANPIMESFGNAKTIRNNNSSRFGKFIQIHFDGVGRISGASIVNYLLEKSRVVYQAPRERNYHLFYQLLAGASEAELKSLYLDPNEEYFYVVQGDCMEIENVDDKEDFRLLKKALDALGINSVPVFKAVAAVLHIGNMSFKKDAKDAAQVETPEPLDRAAHLLGLEPGQLARALTVRSLTSPTGTFYQIPFSKDEAKDQRDALGKAIYGTLFNWIVKEINSALGMSLKVKNFIGVLDIFGFECFEINRFEQFCINYANEKLHQHFIKLMFKLEQVEYQNENIKWDSIEFKDNQPCVEVVDKKPFGVLHLLDEECIFPKGSDGSFLEKAHKAHQQSSYYEKPKKDSNRCFIIKHYAGEIIYTVNGFLDKNRDTYPEGLMKLSEDPWVVELFYGPGGDKDSLTTSTTSAKRNRQSSSVASGSKKGKQGPSVSGQFMGQLANLMTTLDTTQIQYVRCVKPNNVKQAGIIEANYVLTQLRYSGMLECVKIRLMGYSVRRAFNDFYTRYQILSPRTKNCKELVNAINIDQADLQMGKTKVFFRDKILQQLEEMRGLALKKYVIRIQVAYRAHAARKKYKKMKKAIPAIQSWLRMVREKRGYKKLRKEKDEREKEQRQQREEQERADREKRMKEDRERFEAEEKERKLRIERERQEQELREKEEQVRRVLEEKERKEREKERAEREEKEAAERKEKELRDELAKKLEKRKGSATKKGARKSLPPERAQAIAREEVSDWLDALGFTELEEAFFNMGFDDLAVIAELTEKDLDLIGVTKPGHRKKLILAAQQLEKKFKAEPSFQMEWTPSGYRKVTIVPGSEPPPENNMMKGLRFFVNLVKDIVTRPGIVQQKISRYMTWLKQGFSNPSDSLIFVDHLREYRITTETVSNIGGELKPYISFLEELGFCPVEVSVGMFFSRKYITVGIPAYLIEYFGIEGIHVDKMTEFSKYIGSLIDEFGRNNQVFSYNNAPLRPPGQDDGLMNYIGSLSWSSVSWGSN